MSASVEYDGNHIVFGLQWRMLPGVDGEKGEIRRAAKETEAHQYIVLRTQSGVCCGFSEEKPQGNISAYAAAAVFARNCEAANALLLQEIGGGMNALIAIKNSIPVPGMDMVGSREKLVARARDYIQDEGGEGGVVIFGDCTEYFHDVQPFEFNGLRYDPADGFVLAKVPGGASTGKLIIAVISFAAAGWYAYGQFKDVITPEPAPAHQQQQVDPVAAYLAEVSAKLAEEHKVPAATTAVGYIAAMGKMTLAKAGWELMKVTCSSGACTVEWKRKFGTNIDFAGVSEAPTASLVFSDDGAKISEPVKVAPVQTPAEFSAAIDHLPKLGDFRLSTGSLLQRYTQIGLSPQLQAPQPFASSQIPPNLPGGGVWSATWSISGDYGLAADALSRLPGNMNLLQLTVTFNNNKLQFEARGNYYVRK